MQVRLSWLIVTLLSPSSREDTVPEHGTNAALCTLPTSCPIFPFFSPVSFLPHALPIASEGHSTSVAAALVTGNSSAFVCSYARFTGGTSPLGPLFTFR